MSSFSVKPRKRLATARGSSNELNITQTQGCADLYIMPYTDRSFVVMGDTLNHSNALTSLGGKYNTNLRIGQGWIFAKVREESLRHYIATGEIVPYVYSKEQQAKFARSNAAPPPELSKQKLSEVFQDFRDAFDPDEDYEGASIIDVIYQLEEKHLGKKRSVTPQLPPAVRIKADDDDDDDDYSDDAPDGVDGDDGVDVAYEEEEVDDIDDEDEQ